MSDQAADFIADARDPLEGSVVQDRYRIVRRLGEGGMGRVYEGEHLLVKRRVAIKCLHAHYASKPDVLGRFVREAQAASAIGNEHIVDVLDLGKMPDGSPFMAMEFLAGRDLRQTLDEVGTLPVGRAVRIVRQVCDAVAAAHEKSIVHRDLKPENVFLIARGDNPDFVKVLDFGIAKFQSADGAARTGTGVMVGTPSYMAPEQIEDARDVDHRADIYSIGVILYVLLVGAPPFRAESIARLAFEVCTVPPPSVLTARGDVPEALAALIDRLLAKRRDDRVQSCAALAAALLPYVALDGPPQHPPGSAPAGRELLFGTMASSPAAPKPETPQAEASAAPVIATPASPRPRAPLALAAAAALVVVAAIVWRVVVPSPPPPATPVPAAARTVHVFVLIEPDTATLTVDGQPVANPWDAELPASSAPRHIEARAPGHQPWTVDISLQYPQRVIQRLRPLAADAAPPTDPTAPPTDPAAPRDPSPDRSGRGRGRAREARTPNANAPAVTAPTPAPTPTPTPTPTPAARDRAPSPLLDIDTEGQ